MVVGALLVAATLPLHQFVCESVDRRIAAANPTNGLARFLNYTSGGPKDRFVPNPAFWAKGVDFSCASPWNSQSGSLRAGTLISKRHIVFAHHFPLAVGTRIVFVGEDGGVCPCYVQATKAIGNTDIMIGALNAEVTPNIHPAKLLTMDFQPYLGEGVGLPVVTLNREEKAFVTELWLLPRRGSPPGPRNHNPTGKLRQSFREDIKVGDSGNPAFLIVGTEPILLYCLKLGGYGAGPWLHFYLDKIQATMDELCPGYKLETFDFAALERK